MRFIVHIGWHKCGSTAIQKILTETAESLEKKRGICYPQTGRYGLSHHPLAWAMYKTPWVSPSARNITVPYTLDACLNGIREEAVARGCHTVVVSSEELSNIHRYDPALLKNALKHDETTIIAYIRRQDLLVESAYAMSVRWTRQRWRHDFNEYKRRYSALRNLDYVDYFDHWRNLFGNENLVIKLFARNDGWDIRKDFLQAIGGLVGNEADWNIELANSSFPVSLTQFLSLLNQAGADDELFAEVISCFSKYPEKFSPISKVRHVFMSLDDRREFLSRYAGSNRVIGASCFDDERILDLPDDEIAILSECSVPDRLKNAIEVLERFQSVDPTLGKILWQFTPPVNYGCAFMEKISRSIQLQGAAKFTPYFVCGAPRSGTTLLLSLICTSHSVNPLSAECDYFTALVTPFIIGRNRFDLHTNCYFASMEDFERYHADIMRGVLHDMWDFLDRPKKMVLKDPGMTRYANIILKLLPECRMILSIRDPRDVIASRVAIEMRRLGGVSPGEIGSDFIETVCREYNAVHEYVLTLGPEELKRVKLVRYEQLVEGAGLSDLAGFVDVDDIDTDRLWQRSLKMGERKSHNEWVSPLYGEKMSNKSVGRYGEILGNAEVALIVESCKATYEKLLAIGGWDV